MFSQRVKIRTNYLIFILIVIGIIATVNFLSTRRFIRIDLTQNKLYSLSPATKKRLRALDDLVLVKVFFSKKLPPYLITLQRQVKDILAEYHATSRGKVQIEYVDPSGSPEAEQKTRSLGIPAVQLNIRERDKIEVMAAYLGIGVFFEDKKEILPVVDSTANLEYDLTTAIIKVTEPKTKKVAFLFPPEGVDIHQDYGIIRERLEKHYEVTTVEASKEEEIPEDVDTLIVVSPKELKDYDRFEIDQFIMRGGKVIFLLNAVELQEKFGMFARKTSHGLDELLKHYGVKVKSNLVLDAGSQEMASFRTDYFTYTVPYPFWPKVIAENMDKKCPIVSKLECISFPWVSSLEVLKEKCKKEKLEVVELFRTTPRAWCQTERFNLNPQQATMLGLISKDTQKSYLLGVMLTGKFKSFFKGKEIPKKQEGEEKVAQEIIEESPKTQLIVVGDADFCSNRFLRQFPHNSLFFQNAVDFLTLGEDLIEIRSREVTERPLKAISEKGKNFYKFLNVTAIPIIVVLFGLIRAYWRRREKKLYLELLKTR